MNKLSQFLVDNILLDETASPDSNEQHPTDTQTLHIPANIIEEWAITRLPGLLKEITKTGGFGEVDDGPNFFFRDFRVFDKVSRSRAEHIGYEVVKQIMDASFQDLTVYPEYPTGPVKAVTPFPAGVIGKTTATNQKDFDSPRAYDLWFRHAKRVATIVGYSLVREKDDIERRLAVGNLDDLYDDQTATEPSSVNESTFFTREELQEITDDLLGELGGLMIGYAGQGDIEKKQKQLTKLRKKLDKTAPNYPAIKETYDRIEFYLNYYKNLTPSGFNIERRNNDIVISLSGINESVSLLPNSLNIPRAKMPQVSSKNINEATVGAGGITADRLTRYYKALCQNEKIKPLPVKFGRVGYGGAATTYNSTTMKPLYITFDLSRMSDPEYAVIHELTHQIKLETEGNAYTGKKDQSAKFKKLENKLVEKYMYSKFSELLWKPLKESTDMGKNPYVVDIEDLTVSNTDFRNTKWTGENLQMTVMAIEPNQNIGVEVHTDGDQFLRVEKGQGEVYMGRSKEKLDYVKKIKDDTAIFIPAGFWHDIKNTSTIPLKLYVIYAPVEHQSGKVDTVKPIEEVITEAHSTLKLNIPQSVRRIHSAFKRSGKKLYVVGGAVRDAILGKTPKDFDLCTDAKPDEVIQIAQKNGIKYTEVGKAFGVVVVDGMEVATFRADIGKGRRPDSVEYTDIYGDVLRRDLTINALFYDLDKSEIVDLVGGIADLQKNKIRTVGNAIERFDEDPLRKLRAIRFATRLGGKLDKGTFEAILADPSLRGVSEERIRDEFVKSIQSAKSVVTYLKIMDKTKLLHQCFPNMAWKSSDFIEEKNPIILLGYLFRRNTPVNLYKQLMKLKYSHDESNAVKFLIELSDFKPENVFKLKKQQQNTVVSDDDIIRWGKWIGMNFTKFSRFNLTVKGDDVMKMGKRGAEIGKEIERLETQRFLDEDITIPVNVGDTILTGRFKNKKTKVTDIDTDDHGMPTVNGRKVVNFRKEKKDEITEAQFVLRPGFKFLATKTVDKIKKDWWYVIDKIEGAIGNLIYHLKPLNRTQPIQVSVKSPAELYSMILK
jgi:tRNA nucleotidyltransferase/poly(A) polymerase/mannose-6-phosphate isomerase-like protein (cupin superfamily)